jgi:hypothetical protein
MRGALPKVPKEKITANRRHAEIRPSPPREMPNEILDEFILRLLCQCHAQQLEFGRRLALTNIVDEAKITRETNIEVLNRELVKPAIVQTLHPQREDRLDLAAFRPQSRNELSRKILVQQNFHAGCNSF